MTMKTLVVFLGATLAYVLGPGALLLWGAKNSYTNVVKAALFLNVGVDTKGSIDKIETGAQVNR